MKLTKQGVRDLGRDQKPKPKQCTFDGHDDRVTRPNVIKRDGVWYSEASCLRCGREHLVPT